MRKNCITEKTANEILNALQYAHLKIFCPVEKIKNLTEEQFAKVQEEIGNYTREVFQEWCKNEGIDRVVDKREH